MGYEGLDAAVAQDVPHLGGNVRGGDPFTWCPSVWDYAIGRFGLKSVLDFGSGSGTAALYFHRRGMQVCAVDGLAENVENAVFPTVKHDITTGPFVSRFDLIHCQEVVEHIDEKFVANLIETFSSARYVLLTHALPGQAGFHHVNLQPSEYWIKHMEQRSFAFLQEDTVRVRKFAEIDGAPYMARTGLMFGNRDRL